MLKVGITGQAGFIGTHLFNTLSLFKDTYNLVPFNDSYFDDEKILVDFAAQCDTIVHLAAVNRHYQPEYIYSKNIELVDKLIKAIETSNTKTDIIFSSSIQEERENIYGRSKREGREKLAEFCKRNNSGFTGCIIPNVFGPFGRPFYNSVISTFSYQIVNGETPQIEVDAELNLIYINDLVQEIIKILDKRAEEICEKYYVPFSTTMNVTGILEKLKRFGELYLKEGILPELSNSFDINLFNTFRSYISLDKEFPVKCKVNTDARGSFVETIKSNIGGQVSFSTTKPGITRGNHFHTRKIERFVVIKGRAQMQLRRIGTSEVINLQLNGDEPCFVDIPVWFTHNIINTGDEELLTLFWINEFYNPSDPDTFFETV